MIKDNKINKMNNTIHFFDLDGTLWSIPSCAYIIHKERPDKYLINLTRTELKDTLNGIYKKDEIFINYNGKKYWISEQLLDRINKKRRNTEANELGISFLNYTDPNNFKKMVIYKENIRHLINKKGYDIGILSARYSVDNDKMLLKKLKDQLKDMGLSFDKFYYVSNNFSSEIKQSTPVDKVKVLLEHMVGYHIQGDHFVPISQDFYPEIHFYDDEPQNIFVTNNIQEYLEEYIKEAEEDVFKGVMDNIKKKPVLYAHLITGNTTNRFKTTKVQLVEPNKFPITVESLKRFKDF